MTETKVVTRNRVYTVKQYEDGRTTIQGHPVYCPQETETVFLNSQPEVGKRMRFTVPDDVITTTEVVSID